MKAATKQVLRMFREASPRAKTLSPMRHAPKKLYPLTQKIEFFLITDSKKINPVTAAKKLPPNCGIILRDYELTYNQRLSLAKNLKEICRQKNLILLIARDTKLALAVKADGMHFPEFMHQTARRWKVKRPDWIITVSAHSKPAMIRAYNTGADAVLLSPVFKTTSHPDKKHLGLVAAGNMVMKKFPAYALGGIKLKHLNQVKNKGFQGLAGISWIAPVLNPPQSPGEDS